MKWSINIFGISLFALLLLQGCGSSSSSSRVSDEGDNNPTSYSGDGTISDEAANNSPSSQKLMFEVIPSTISVSLRWDLGDHAGHYKLIKTSEGDSSQVLVSDSDQHTLTDYDVAADAYYRYVLNTYDSNGELLDTLQRNVHIRHYTQTKSDAMEY